MSLFEFDSSAADDLAARFNLRAPNAEGLRQAIFSISGQDECEQIVLSMATGVGKTWLLAALLEYAAQSGVKNLLVVLPGKTVRTKTINNFTPGAPGYITGSETEMVVITPQNFTANSEAILDDSVVKLFLMNIHHLVQQDTEEYVVPGSAKATQTRTARPQEVLGSGLLDHLAQVDDLFMVLDESHSFSESAKTWAPALERLRPAARVGLTATPVTGDNVVFNYTLAKAIADQYVKTPVIALRRNGYRDNEEAGRLRDAKHLLDMKAVEYREVESANPGLTPINPILLVACRDTDHAEEVAAILRGSELFDGAEQVLVVHSNRSSDAEDELLENVQAPDSPVRVIVQVDMLSQGWNVHNVSVLVPLRALGSRTLTEQIIGRGLRLPYGRYTGNEWVDSLDILSHESVVKAMSNHGITGERPVAEPSTNGDRPVVAERQPSAVDSSDSDLTQPVFSYEPDDPFSQELTLDLSALTDDGSELAGTVSALGGTARDVTAVVEEDIQLPEPVVVNLLREDSFNFPLAVFVTTPNRLDIDTLDSAWHQRVALTVGNNFVDAIDRETLILQGDGAVSLASTTRVELFERPIEREDVEATLLVALRPLRALSNGPLGQENRNRLPAFVKRFVDFMPGEWTPKRAAVAVRRLVEEVNLAADEAARRSVERPSVSPLLLPKRKGYTLMGSRTIVPQAGVDAKSFQRFQHYSGWNRNRYSASPFDAYATEMAIARMLDVSPQISWWMRLEQSDQARIEYGGGRSYYPDFVAADVDGVHWIIEGKDERGREDAVVQAKRGAAELVIRMMESLDEWRHTRWGYLIAYQGDLQEADESWQNLRAMAGAQVMRPA